MSDPLSFDSATPRLTLPLLFAGQSQKEFFVNEALLRLDLATQCAVEGTVESPPPDAGAGQAWLIGTAPQGDFAGRAGHIAGWTTSGWRYLEPFAGLRVYDRSQQSFRFFDGAWRSIVAPPAPVGGPIVDTEVRTALAQLIQKLAAAGIFAAN